MDTTQKILVILAILCFAALILMGACGCTVSRVYVYAPTYQVGANHYQRSTSITADDSDTADVSTEADVGLRLPLSP